MDVFYKRKLVIILIVLIFTIIFPATNFSSNLAGSFKEFLNNTNSKAQLVLANHAPRDIIIPAPKKYIKSLEIIHSKKGSVSSESVSLTNIDVVTTGVDVQTVMVTINNHSSRAMERFEVNGDEKKFHTGFAGLKDNFDLTFSVYSTRGVLIERKIFKVPAESEDIFTISQEFTYNTAGNEYSLYDLLSDENIFTDLLIEHRLEDLYYKLN